MLNLISNTYIVGISANRVNTDSSVTLLDIRYKWVIFCNGKRNLIPSLVIAFVVKSKYVRLTSDDIYRIPASVIPFFDIESY